MPINCSGVPRPSLGNKTTAEVAAAHWVGGSASAEPQSAAKAGRRGANIKKLICPNHSLTHLGLDGTVQQYSPLYLLSTRTI